MRTFHSVTVLTMMFTSHKSRAIKLQVMRSHLKVSELQPMHIHVQLDVQTSVNTYMEWYFLQTPLLKLFLIREFLFSSAISCILVWETGKNVPKSMCIQKKLGEQDDSSKSPGLPIILAHQRPLFFSLQEISHTFATV